MLRAFVIAIGVTCIAAGVFVAIAAPRVWPLALELGCFGILVLVGVFFERHYRGRTAPASARLEQTGERFLDPTTSKLTEVLYDSDTGERIYRQLE